MIKNNLPETAFDDGKGMGMVADWSENFSQKALSCSICVNSSPTSDSCSFRDQTSYWKTSPSVLQSRCFRARGDDRHFDVSIGCFESVCRGFGKDGKTLWSSFSRTRLCAGRDKAPCPTS